MRSHRHIEQMRLKRRQFLQQGGLALTALGLGEAARLLFGNSAMAAPIPERYQQALAQPISRKLALLVGINQYIRNGETKLITPLQGCVTDVELQKELLIYKFGFNPTDILTLTDKDATRQNIETAFLEHLINQAQASDVVVFHFSGYGSQVSSNEELIQNCLVSVDSVVPTSGVVGASVLLEETLLLLLRSLATDQVTTILDTSFNNPTSAAGNLRVRSLASTLTAQTIAEELVFQEQLLKQFNKPELLKKNQIPGIVLTAASPNQIATEVPWSGFNAGLFTYALTQSLWEANPSTTLYFNFSRTVSTIQQLVGKQQYPQLSGKKSNQQSLLAYNLPAQPSADGVVIAVEDSIKNIQLSLPGIPATVLSYYGINSLFTVISSNSADNEKLLNADTTISPVASQPLQLIIRSREGITAKARILGASSDNTAVTPTLKVGDLVQEAVRVLPRNIGLSIGLDTRLERIERVDATSAFASVSANVSSVLSFVVTGDQSADYIFGKVINETNTNQQETKGEKENLTPSGGSYGLFSLNYRLIPNTTGEIGEAVKVAVNRLVPTLKTLLAAKLWRLTANEGSSRLGVRATVEIIAPEEKVVMQRETLRNPYSEEKPLSKENSSKQNKLKSQNSSSTNHQTAVGLTTVPIGSRILYRVQNYSEQPIYLIMLGLDSSGSAIAFHALQSAQTSDIPNPKPSLKEIVVPAKETLTLPQTSASLEWVMHGPTGIAETYIICSKAPFTQTMAALEAAKRPQRQQEQVMEIVNPLDVARALLLDLHQASATNAGQNLVSIPDPNSAVSDSYILDVNTWATLSFVYEIA